MPFQDYEPCGQCDGYGSVRDPNSRWWQFWKCITCPDCGGAGWLIPSPGQVKQPSLTDPLQVLKVDYDHPDVHDLVAALRQLFAIYANPDNWRESADTRRYDPHGLRAGKMLDFYPCNVTDGYRFAREAIDKIDRFYAADLGGSQSTEEAIRELRREIETLKSERRPQHAAGWGGTNS